MAVNLRYQRTGSLFQKPFKRILVDTDRYFAALVKYIQRNPQKHGLVADFHKWPWSSYGAILGDSAMPTFEKLASLRIPRNDVLAWFGGRAAFVALHQTDPDERPIAEYLIE
ncbi:MAG: hypothetical protein M5U01_16770 [Ardenticatenaceae bacterium]|nr:hypothetical protein [Ardenticatenaceae bacterium]HBY97695.1 hypothetical protein [Chloroflexota bacterium]